MKLNLKTAGKFLSIVMLSAIALACTEPPDDSAEMPPTGESTEEVTPEMMSAIEEKTWSLVSYDEQPVLADSEITLELSAGQLNGSAGCNQYFADYQLEAGQLSVGAAGSTRKICLEGGVMAQESAYLSLLQQAQSAEVTDNGLIIQTAEGNLVFEAADIKG
ncbi:MAG: META domain-containing protein [Phormidesmis sp.]